jgi:hypothetical protein
MGEEKEDHVTYWLTPVQSEKFRTAVAIIQILVGQESIFAFGNRGTVKSSLKPDDKICFYASRTGIVAHARVASVPERKQQLTVDYQRYPWVVRLKHICLYLNNPVVIDDHLRKCSDAFHNREPDVPWSWFVQHTRRISTHDFRILTRHEASSEHPQ